MSAITSIENISITSTAIPNDNLLRLEHVMQITSLCRSHVYLLMKQGKFPTSLTVGVRGSRWSELEVRRWVADQIAIARQEPVPTVPTVGTDQWGRPAF